jgi:CubicO group peptidase (beta-lactamase class C family)
MIHPGTANHLRNGEGGTRSEGEAGMMGNKGRGARRFAAILFTAILFGMALVGPAAALAAQDTRAEVLQRFTERIRADVEADGIASITLGVQIGDSLVFARSFGFADRARGIEARPDMLYRIGSISKTFTAVLLADLVEDGFLALDDPVRDALPAVESFQGMPEGSAPITFRQMGSHTAGLVREPALRGAATGPIELWEQRIFASIPATAFQDPPGARYSYSNIGFGVLGLAVARAAGGSFMDLVRDRIFAPLGMERTTFVVDTSLAPYLTAGHANRRDGTVDVEGPAREHDGRGYKVPNGGIYSTAGDLGRFMAALWGGEPTMLIPASLAEMTRVQTPEDPLNGYGLGLTISTDEAGRRTVGHGGSVAGYTAQMTFDPDARIGVVLLRNYGSGATNLSRTASELLNALRAGSRG